MQTDMNQCTLDFAVDPETAAGLDPSICAAQEDWNTAVAYARCCVSSLSALASSETFNGLGQAKPLNALSDFVDDAWHILMRRVFDVFVSQLAVPDAFHLDIKAALTAWGNTPSLDHPGPMSFWDHLNRGYPDTTASAARIDAANQLRSFFDRNSVTVQRQRARAVIRLSVWADSYNPNRYSYSSAQSVRDLLGILLTWASLNDDYAIRPPMALSHFCADCVSRLWHHDVVSREVVVEDAWIKAITMKSSFILEIPLDVCDAIEDFMDRWLQPE